MEIHSPEHPIHTWRDFFIHIATIVVGLLIAIGLEQSVEAMHNRHLRHTAERNLALEMDANQKLLAEDQKQLRGSVQHLRDALGVIAQLRAHKESTGSLAAQWDWNDVGSAAWDTARATNAASLMPYNEAQRYADLYSQQTIVNEQSTVYIREIYAIGVPLQVGTPLAQLTPAQLDAMETAIGRSIADAAYLLDLCRGLETMYKDRPEPIH